MRVNHETVPSKLAVPRDAEQRAPPEIRNQNEDQNEDRNREACLLAANAIPIPELNIHEVEREKTASKTCAPVTTKQRFEKLLSAVSEGHEEYLGLTPD
jgi:hypothetical protein